MKIHFENNPVDQRYPPGDSAGWSLSTEYGQKGAPDVLRSQPRGFRPRWLRWLFRLRRPRSEYRTRSHQDIAPLRYTRPIWHIDETEIRGDSIWQSVAVVRAINDCECINFGGYPHRSRPGAGSTPDVKTFCATRTRSPKCIVSPFPLMSMKAFCKQEASFA